MKHFFLFLFSIFLIPVIYCHHLEEKKVLYTFGVVEIYDFIPKFCNKTQGIKQKQVILAKSEKQLIEHYGITFLVSFNDQISPILYGTLYYIDPEKNLYCMALPNEKIAVFKDRKLDAYRNNVMQEICYPIKLCEIYDSKNYIFNKIQ